MKFSPQFLPDCTTNGAAKNAILHLIQCDFLGCSVLKKGLFVYLGCELFCDIAGAFASCGDFSSFFASLECLLSGSS